MRRYLKRWKGYGKGGRKRRDLRDMEKQERWKEDGKAGRRMRRQGWSMKKQEGRAEGMKEIWRSRRD